MKRPGGAEASETWCNNRNTWKSCKRVNWTLLRRDSQRFAKILRFLDSRRVSLRRFVRRHEKEHLIVLSVIDIEYYQDQYLEMAVFASDTWGFGATRKHLCRERLLNTPDSKEIFLIYGARYARKLSGIWVRRVFVCGIYILSANLVVI